MLDTHQLDTLRPLEDQHFNLDHCKSSVICLGQILQQHLFVQKNLSSPDNTDKDRSVQLISEKIAERVLDYCAQAL